MTRHMFAGALTPLGFVDFFDHAILPTQKAQSRYFLKGASGGGKGTFMRRVADRLAEHGHEIELFHCANDANSLDAVVAPHLGLCIMDATAPHSRDPQIPAVTDHIIDFAQFLDKSKLANYKQELENLANDKKVLMAKAQGYLAAAGKVYNADKAAAETALTRRGKLCSPISNTQCISKNRQLFLSTITPEGLISYADNAFDDCHVYDIRTEEQIGASQLLADIQQTANANGINTETFHHPLDPSQISHLHIPDHKQAFITSCAIFGYNGKISETIDLTPCINPAMFERIKVNMEQDNELLNALIEQAAEQLSHAKALHTKIERIYIGAMDFGLVDEMTEGFLEKMFA
ncbi:MAG: hypothetical protein FWE34_09050 [Defluviitaleaceae bacterium]|nr:hypothetical protein [Defluviitaleaceae bacterium]